MPQDVWWVALLLSQSGRHLSLPQMPRHMKSESTKVSTIGSAYVWPPPQLSEDKTLGVPCEPPPTPGGEAQIVQPPCTKRLPWV